MPDKWSASETSAPNASSMSPDRSPREGVPGVSPPPCTTPPPTSFHDPTGSLHLPSNLVADDPPSSRMDFVAGTPPNQNRQEQVLPEELTGIATAPTPATEELIDLLQALGNAAPQALRNRHKIYSILRISRDICDYIGEIGNPREPHGDSNIRTVLTRTEDYCALLDALEDWLSRLLYGGIHPEILTQFPDVPETHPVFTVTNGLKYLETEMKRRVSDEPTRDLIIDIATLLAQTLANTSPEDDDDDSLQKTFSLCTEADRDWLVQALAE
ncbi:hypothetical protein FRC01_013815 [Tulasnella sp. 417]|nr:hypothetical protein FRC01_013815 [Tulasnella sp. 417]